MILVWIEKNLTIKWPVITSSDRQLSSKLGQRLGLSKYATMDKLWKTPATGR